MSGRWELRPRRRTRRIRIRPRRRPRDAQTAKDRRPVFPRRVAGGIQSDPNSVALKRPPCRLFFHRQITVRQALGQQRSQHARPIGRVFSVIRARYNNPAQCITDAVPRAAVQRYKVARIAAQQRRNQKRLEEIVRRSCSHRRTEPFSVTTHSLTISAKRIPRLTDSRAGGGTEKTGRSDAFIRKEFELLFAAQRLPAGRNIWKNNRPPAENFDCGIEGILVLLRRVFLFCRGRIGEALWLRLLLRRRRCDDAHQQCNQAQSRWTVPHSLILS